VLTYNVHCGIGNDGVYSLDRISSLIRRSGADIACLQEVEFNSGLTKTRKWSAAHADRQPMLLSKASGLNHWSFVGPLAARVDGDADEDSCFKDEVLARDSKNEAVYGNAVLSRFPILDKRTLLFQPREPPLSSTHIYMDREEQPRGACAVLVDIMGARGGGAPAGHAHQPGGPLCCLAPQQQAATGTASPVVPLWVVNTHLSHKFSSEEQRGQARQLLDWIDDICNTYDGPVKPGFIMCGDLNAPPFLPSSSYSTLIADGRWRDLWHERGSLCCQATYPSACGTTACGIRIDHILALQADRAARLLCDEIRILGDPTDADLSDHFAVVADIAVKP